jgi:transcriptional regulator with XRE-family HTH domain
MEDPFASYRGALIREKRRSKDMTLTDLAGRTGLSISFISQVETGGTNPSVNSLRKIALALDTPLSSFFEETAPSIQNDPHHNGPVVRKHNRKVLRSKDSLLTYQLLSSDPDHRIEFLITRLEVGGVSAESPMTHNGDEAALILQGECKIELEGQVFDLNEGDFIYIREKQPHKFSNTGNIPLIIVGAISPPGF